MDDKERIVSDRYRHEFENGKCKWCGEGQSEETETEACPATDYV